MTQDATGGRARTGPAARDGESWLYGIHTVAALVRGRPRAVREVRLAADSRNPRLAEIAEQAGAGGIRLRSVPAEDLDEQLGSANHQGVAAAVDLAGIAWSEHELEALLEPLAAKALLLVLDGVQDPHNLGALLRTADAAGVDAVVAAKDRAARITPVVCKVASGAVGHVPFVQVTNLARTLRRLRDAGLWIVGADMESAEPLFEADLTGPLALVMGGEGRGLRRLTREHCDLMVAIPMAGAVESLNVSVAAGVCLFEIRRQRGINGVRLD